MNSNTDPKRLIYVCSPLSAPTRAEMLTNAAKALTYMNRAEAEFGVKAVAPHAYLPYLLDDHIPEQRALALEFGQKLLAMCNMLIVFGDTVSAGMKHEIEMAVTLKIPILFRPDIEGRSICEPGKTISAAVAQPALPEGWISQQDWSDALCMNCSLCGAITDSDPAPGEMKRRGLEHQGAMEGNHNETASAPADERS